MKKVESALMNSKKSSNQNASSFEQDLKSLEEIVNALESGKLPLDAALQQFETGVNLVRKCEKTLGAAERKIELLVKGMDGELETAPFDESSTSENPEKESKAPSRNARKNDSKQDDTSEPFPTEPPEYSSDSDGLF